MSQLESEHKHKAAGAQHRLVDFTVMDDDLTKLCAERDAALEEAARLEREGASEEELRPARQRAAEALKRLSDQSAD